MSVPVVQALDSFLDQHQARELASVLRYRAGRYANFRPLPDQLQMPAVKVPHRHTAQWLVKANRSKRESFRL